MKKKLFAVVIGLLLLFSTLLAVAGSFDDEEGIVFENELNDLADSAWPSFGRDERNTGRSPYDTSDISGMQKWRFSTGWIVRSSPVIAEDGTIYIGSRSNRLYAVNPDGTEKWNFTTGGNIDSTPAIGSDGTVYIGSHDSVFYAINPDGTEKWNFSTGGFIDGPAAIGSDGTVYFGSNDNNLYALDPNGNEIWNFTTGGNVRSSPAIAADGTLYFGSADGNLYALSPAGVELWNFTAGNTVRTPAIGDDGTIYVGSIDNRLYAINPDGSESWNFTTGNDVYSSPAIGSDGTIYVGSVNNRVYAVNPDGSEKWNFTTGGAVRSSPAISNDDIIYIGSNDNSLYAINSDGSERWSFSTGFNVYPSPAIGSDGTIYVSTLGSVALGGYLYAIGNMPFFDVNITAYDDEVYIGEEVTLEYTVTNTGVLGDTQDIIFRVAGEPVDVDPDITLNPGEVHTGQFTWTPEQAGNFRLRVDSDDTNQGVWVTVNPNPAFFQVTITSYQDNLILGDSMTLGYNIKNTGDESDTQNIFFYANGNLVDLELDETLDGQEEFNGTFSWTPVITGTFILEVNSDDDSDSVTVTVTDDAVDTYTLTVNIEGEGSVNQSPDQASYVDGTTVTLTAVPEDGWEFVEWTGDATGTDLETTVVMDDDKTVTATFVEEPPVTYTLTVSVIGDGSVTRDPLGDEFEEGTTVTLTAVPTAGWEFVGWSGDADGTALETTVLMDDDKTVTATFQTEDEVYELVIDSTDGGSVTTPGEGSFDRIEGTEVNLVAVADDHHEFVEWTGDVGTIDDTSSAETTITMNGDYSITAVFEPIEYELTVSSGSGGSVVTPGEGIFSYEYGEVVDLVAEADEDYEFVEWTGDIDTLADPASPTTNITIHGDYSITAVFETDLQEYTLTIEVQGQGTTDPAEGSHDYVEGRDVTVTATPSDGWRFVEWTGDATGTSLSITVTMDDDKSITAIFEEIEEEDDDDDDDDDDGILPFGGIGIGVLVVIIIIIILIVMLKKRGSGGDIALDDTTDDIGDDYIEEDEDYTTEDEDIEE